MEENDGKGERERGGKRNRETFSRNKLHRVHPTSGVNDERYKTHLIEFFSGQSRDRAR